MRTRTRTGHRATLLALAGALATTASPAAADAQTCANAAFGAVGPDCRAIEQVSPADKNGRAISSGPVYTASSGGSVTFRSFGAFADNASSPGANTFLARRDADGWSVRGIDPPLSLVVLNTSAATIAVSQDGTKSVVASRRVLAPGGDERGPNLYLRDLTQPASYTFIANVVPGGVAQTSTLVVDGTPDFSAIGIQSGSPLVTGGADETGPIRLYRWTAGDGLEFVDRTNTFLPADPADEFPFDSWSRPPVFDESRRTVSADGVRVTYERYSGNTAEDLAPEIRQFADGASRLVSHPNGRPGVAADGRTPIASPDGRQVTFVSADALTPQSPSDGESVYRWSAASNTSVDLLAGLAGLAPRIAGLSVQAVSPDGRYVWLRSTGPLINGNGLDAGGLYALDTSDGTLTLGVPLPAAADAVLRFSPDGATVALAAPGNGGGATAPQCIDGFCPQQLFTYRLRPSVTSVCVTCDGQPLGQIGIDESESPVRSTAVLDDGRVFFDTNAQLDPRDVDAATDVYQYTPRPNSVAGVRTLLSDGPGVDPTRFAGASRDGVDVYMISLGELVGADDDDRGDLFSARAGGGLASQRARPAASSCAGEACRPPATAVAGAVVPSGSSDGAVPVAPAPPPAFAVSTPSASALRSAARTGRLDVRVTVGAPGTLSAGLRSAVRGSTRTVAVRTVRLASARTTTLRLRLSRAARAKLRRTGALTARLTVAYSERTNRVRKTIRLAARRGGSTQRGSGR